jgi:hypothetical protein
MKRPFYTDFAWAYDLLIQEPVAERLEFVTGMLARHGVTRGAHLLDAGSLQEASFGSPVCYYRANPAVQPQ